eukprot:jgi/Psemu1/9351/gm1.9351_g
MLRSLLIAAVVGFLLWKLNLFLSPYNYSKEGWLQLFKIVYIKIYDIRDFLMGTKLVPQTEPLVYGPPLGGNESLSSEVKTLGVQEMTKEIGILGFGVDFGHGFDVKDLDSLNTYCHVKKPFWHIPGKDKLQIKFNGKCVVEATKKILAIPGKPTYEVFRGDTKEKIGLIERDILSVLHKFEFHAEIPEEPKEDGPLLDAKDLFEKGDYVLRGDPTNRDFVMKNKKGQCVARVTTDKPTEINKDDQPTEAKKDDQPTEAKKDDQPTEVNKNHKKDYYQMKIAPGMDPILVLACVCIMDGELDAIDAAKKKEQEEAKKKQKPRKKKKPRKKRKARKRETRKLSE